VDWPFMFSGCNPVQSLKIFSGLFSSSVMAAFASITISAFNCYCWTPITIVLFVWYVIEYERIMASLVLRTCTCWLFYHQAPNKGEKNKNNLLIRILILFIFNCRLIFVFIVQLWQVQSQDN